MKSIELTETAKYNGQDMKWTETPTHIVELKKGDKLYHKTTNKIKEFLSKESCFYNNTLDEIIDFTGYTSFIYEIEILKDMKIQGYSNDSEVRFEITQENSKMFYIGKIEVYDNYTTKEILTKRGRLETIKIYDKEFKKV